MPYISNLKSACKEAAWVFVVSRVIIIFVAYVGFTVLPQVKQQIAVPQNRVRIGCDRARHGRRVRRNPGIRHNVKLQTEAINPGTDFRL